MRRLWILALLLSPLNLRGQTNCGNTGTPGSDFNNQINAVKTMAQCQPSVASTVSDCQLYIGAGSLGTEHCDCAIYLPDGTAGAPHTLLCSGPSTVIASTGAYNTCGAPTGCGILSSSTNYWIAVNLDSNNTHVRYKNFTDNGPYESFSFGSFPNPMVPTANSAALDMYLVLNAVPTQRHQAVVARAVVPTSFTIGTKPLISWTPARSESPTITASDIDANIDALHTLGIYAAWAAFQTPWISPDYNWSSGRDGTSHLLNINATYYPSGVTPVAAYAHTNGFKFMIYLAPGSIGCAGFPSSYGYYQSDANQVTGYGVDGVRGDSCTNFASNLVAQTEYADMSIAMSLTGLGLYFDCSVDASGNSVYLFSSPTWARGIPCFDVWTEQDRGAMTFSTLKTEIDNQFDTGYLPCGGVTCASLTQSGRFNEIDFLGLCGDTSLTGVEPQANFALFAIMKSPLVASGNFVTDSNCYAAGTVTILSNTEILAVNQDSGGTGATRVAHASCGSDYCDTIAVPLSGGEGGSTYAVVLWNRASTAQNITLTFSGLPESPGSSYYVRDLVAHTDDAGSPFTTTYTVNSIASHGVAVLALCPAGACTSLY